MNRHTTRVADTARVRDPLFVSFVVLAVVVGVVAMATSARTLAALGEAVGWTQTVAVVSMGWALPVSVDALALVGGLAWLTAPKDSSARRMGVCTTVGAVLASIVLNGMGHLVELGRYTPDTRAVLVISAVPPVVAALVLHLVHLVATDRADTSSAPEPQEHDTAVLEPAHPEPETDTHPAFDSDADTAEAPEPEQDDTEPEGGDTEPDVPPPGGRLSDTELDMVVTVLASEAEPPRSFRELEDRFRELGYTASAARLRAAYKRVQEEAAA